MRSAAILLLGLSVVPPLQAQDRATIAQLETLRDSLAGITDSMLINRLTRDLKQEARRRSGDPVAGLRSALAVLRQAQLGDGRLFSTARGIFQHAGRLEPAWSYPEFGVGLAELGRGHWMAANPAELGNRVGYGPYRAAIRAFANALQVNHRFEAPGLMLAGLVEELRDTAIVREALSALAPLVAADSAGSDVLLAMGRLERRLGDYEAAVHSFTRSHAAGANDALSDLETARSLLAIGGIAGESLYYSGAASNNPSVVTEYRSDLAPIAEAAELEEFDRLSGPDRVAWLNQFWLRRDYFGLRSPGERLREHYRRLYYARRNFALRVNRRYYTHFDLFKNLDASMDDRGVVYIRQGEPDLRIGPPLFGLNANETWVYRRSGGDLLLHFGAGGDSVQGAAVDDYRLVHGIYDLYRAGGHPDMLLLSRVPASPLYNRMLAWGPNGQARALAEEQRQVEESAMTGITTDDYQLRYEHQLDAAAQLLVIGGSGSELLHLVFAIRDSTTGPVRIRLRLFDPAMNPGAAFDTTVSPASHSGALKADLGHVILPVPAGKWKYRLALERGDAGWLFPSDSISVGYLGGLGLSDLALALPLAGIVWQPVPGDSVVFSPVQAFRPDQGVEVYYEVYGLAAGRKYETRVAVLESRGGQERLRLELRFNEESGGEVSRIHRTVQLNGLRKGSYWLEVRVRDEEGIERKVRTVFQVL